MKLLRHLLLGLAFLGTNAWAQTWPTRPITVIIPYSAGGSSDLLARTMIPEIEKRLKVEVRPAYHVGANALVAVKHMLSNPNDDHTFMIVLDDLVTGAVFNNLTHLPEFSPTNIFATAPFFLNAPATTDVRAARERFRQMVQNKKPATVGTSGLASSAVIWLRGIPELTNLTFIPYRGVPQIWGDLKGGHLDYSTFTGMATVESINSNNTVPLFVSTSKRFDRLPDVPTFREMGLTNGESYAWFAWIARKDTSTLAQETWSKTINDIIRDGGASRFDDRLTWTGFNIKQSNEFYNNEIRRYQNFYQKNRHLFQQQ